MSPAAVTAAAAEINRLYEEATHCASTSRQALHGALVAAWQAGHLLVAERKRVFHMMGAGAWLFWLKANFRGTARTAQRYMRLAHSIADAALLQGMSLRQAYSRLGIATEPKTPGKRRLRHTLPAHIVHANRLLRSLKRRPGQTADEQGEAYRRDLWALFEKLRPWFESSASSSATFCASERPHKYVEPRPGPPREEPSRFSRGERPKDGMEERSEARTPWRM